ncbi:MAG TPA: alkaline phosphatase family protein [Gammaproteobacteria bacterium]|nr:hypothetical protein [Gammaproteobacteria bacterium]MDP7661417.1 alkaline phosphatase family protein [Gammaproteobacteria bacterium]HJP39355.1 alkaline phosphatase family protein [Gammaproteobacteria bacterium]
MIRLVLVLLLALPVMADAARRMVLFGVDGMDPLLLQQFIDDGDMPNLEKLAATGGFMPLATSIPPQSPVAWSDFITGMNPGGHGIFDFIAIDRKTMLPYLSSARVVSSGREPLAIGRWRIPFSAEETVLLRDGHAFWEVLDEAGIPATIFRVPVNYPPIPAGESSLSGMGTPDLRGTSGTFSFITTDSSRQSEEVPGGEIIVVKRSGNVVPGELIGPSNAFLENTPRSVLPYIVHLDNEHPVALIEIGNEQVLLNVGEWSEWISVHFPMVPGLVDVPGMVRLFLRQVSPHLELYISPINIDPRDAAQPIANPAEYAFELAEAAGPFYTQEMPEDTKALSAHVLTPDQFLDQSDLVMDERRRLFRYELQRFHESPGDRFLFFYLSSVDQRNHMLARQMDADHPFHEADTPARQANAMRTIYREVDEMVGWAMEILDAETALIVMSDHGFAPFRRQANLNSWLEQNGYLTLKNPELRDESEWLTGIDWAQTKAFSIGLNSLYINTLDRERDGVVAPQEREALAREIVAKLKTWKDPESGEFVVTQPLIREDVYSGLHLDDAPDIIVGYARGYRASWATGTGKVPAVLLEDNNHEWSGDHCMDSRTVPGVLLSNRQLIADKASLRDMSGTILRYFGVEPPPAMRNRELL